MWSSLSPPLSEGKKENLEVHAPEGKFFDLFAQRQLLEGICSEAPMWLLSHPDLHHKDLLAEHPSAIPAMWAEVVWTILHADLGLKGQLAQFIQGCSLNGPILLNDV